MALFGKWFKRSTTLSPNIFSVPTASGGVPIPNVTVQTAQHINNIK